MDCMHTMGIAVLPSVNLYNKMLLTALEENFVFYERLQHNQNNHNQNGLSQVLQQSNTKTQ